MIFIASGRDPPRRRRPHPAAADRGPHGRSELPGPSTPTVPRKRSIFCDQWPVIDLLITEVVLPGMDGFDLTLSARELKPDLPMIYVVTEDQLTPEMFQILRQPRDVLLLKPFDRPCPDRDREGHLGRVNWPGGHVNRCVNEIRRQPSPRHDFSSPSRR